MTKQGAINRSKAAFDSYVTQYGCSPKYAIGLEGGIATIDNTMECFAWMAIYDGEKIGNARTASFPLPQKIKELVDNGMELGHADDIVFGRTNSKQGNGAVGLLTQGVIDRAAYYEHAVVLAMIPFLWPDLY